MHLFVLVQVAWSPAWKEGSARYAMVAVSTKAGRVWLWRYRLPLEYSVAADSKDLADKFVLVGLLGFSQTNGTCLGDSPVHAAIDLSTLPTQHSMPVSESLIGCGLMYGFAHCNETTSALLGTLRSSPYTRRVLFGVVSIFL